MLFLFFSAVYEVGIINLSKPHYIQVLLNHGFHTELVKPIGGRLAVIALQGFEDRLRERVRIANWDEMPVFSAV